LKPAVPPTRLVAYDARVGRAGADDEATRVDASILRKGGTPDLAEPPDEATEVIRRDDRPSFDEITRRRPPRTDALESEPAPAPPDGPPPRGTVAGRMSPRDEGPPLPFKTGGGSVPPPRAVDLYERDELDPLGVTGKVKKVDRAALPFSDAGAAPIEPLPAGDPMNQTSAMRQKVQTNALPFDGPQPKYPPKQLVPLEQNPLWAGGSLRPPQAHATGSSNVARLAIVAVVVLALVVALTLLLR